MKIFLTVALLLSLAGNFFLAGIWLGKSQNLEQKAVSGIGMPLFQQLSPESQQKLQPLLQQKRPVLRQKLRQSQRQRQAFLAYIAQAEYDEKQAEVLFARWQQANQESQVFLRRILLEAAQQLPPKERQRLFQNFNNQQVKQNFWQNFQENRKGNFEENIKQKDGVE